MINKQQAAAGIEAARSVASRYTGLAVRCIPNWRSFHPSPLDLAVQLAGLRIGVPDVFAIHAALTPDRLALSDEAETISYAAAARAIDSIAEGLRGDLGVTRGDAVALVLENSVDYVLAWFALLRLGARVVHASFESTAAELTWLAQNAGVRVAFVSRRSVEAAVTARNDENRPLRLVAGAGLRDLRCESSMATLRNTPTRRRLVKPRILRRTAENVVYTSGTTGRPKGAVRDLGGAGISELARIVERLPMQSGDRQLVVSRLYHSGAQAFVVLGLALGQSLYIQRRFEPEATVAALEAHRIQHVFMVPTMLRRVLDVLSARAIEADLLALRSVVSGAAEFPHKLRLRACAQFGPHRVFDFYGATELGWITLIRGDEMIERPRSVGRPLAGQAIRIDDPERLEIDGVLRDVGTIRTRTQHAMSGYLNDRDATEAATDGTWTTVEDTGYVDSDGFLYLAGRRREMIISGGVNVYPAEVEDVIVRAEGVVEASVIGIPDEEWGERVVACVVGSHLDPSALDAHVRAALSPAKVPRAWVIVDELPRNPTGKVLKAQLRADAMRRLAPASPRPTRAARGVTKRS